MSRLKCHAQSILVWIDFQFRSPMSRVKNVFFLLGNKKNLKSTVSPQLKVNVWRRGQWPGMDVCLQILELVGIELALISKVELLLRLCKCWWMLSQFSNFINRWFQLFFSLGMQFCENKFSPRFNDFWSQIPSPSIEIPQTTRLMTKQPPSSLILKISLTRSPLETFPSIWPRNYNIFSDEKWFIYLFV